MAMSNHAGNKRAFRRALDEALRAWRAYLLDLPDAEAIAAIGDELKQFGGKTS